MKGKWLLGYDLNPLGPNDDQYLHSTMLRKPKDDYNCCPELAQRSANI